MQSPFCILINQQGRIYDKIYIVFINPIITDLGGLNMAYAVDFVLKVMDEISSYKPVMFQRDGSLYVASGQGFGKVSHGLQTWIKEIPSWSKEGQPPEILESVSAIEEWVGYEWDKKPKFLDGEVEYLRPIVFGADDNSFSLNEVLRAARELAELPDDGKIRMVRHGSSYHSHKYGYASDGIDVYLTEARIMDRDRYLGLVRAKEDMILQDIRARMSGVEERHLSEAYQRVTLVTLPDCLILTPNMLVSLPRSGRLEYHRDRNSWTNTERFQENVLRLYSAETNTESPYGVQVILNAKNQFVPNTESLSSGVDAHLTQLKKELDAVVKHMPLADAFNARLNELHNEVMKPDIESYKRVMKIIKGKREILKGEPVTKSA